MEEQTPSTYTVRLTPEIEASFLPFSQQDWDKTPRLIQAFVISTMTRLGELGKKIDQIESKLQQDSSNSSRPPSSDSPYKRKPKDKKRRKPSVHKQVMLDPTQSEEVKPERCSCGCEEFGESRPYPMHQMIELPEVKMDVFHGILHQVRCAKYGKLMIHPKRSKEAFAALIKDWEGILVSDGYRVYKQWVNLRQTGLAHLIRTADGLSQRSDPEIAAFGRWAAAEIRRLSHMGSCTSYLRFGVLWRKRSFGASSEKGNRWVERILSRQTCGLQSRPMFPVLVEAVECHFKAISPDLSWISAE